MRPLRRVALILGVVALIELAAILFSSDCERELIAERRRYEQAWLEHERLTRSLCEL